MNHLEIFLLENMYIYKYKTNNKNKNGKTNPNISH